MSYVTDLLLLFSLEEYIFEYESPDDCAPMIEIQQWLEQREFSPLVNLSELASTEKAMQAVVYGGALNYFDIRTFALFLRS